MHENCPNGLDRRNVLAGVEVVTVEPRLAITPKTLPPYFWNSALMGFTSKAGTAGCRKLLPASG